jgi:hypothetical protein
MSSRWSTPWGGFPCARTPVSYWDTLRSPNTPQEDEVKQHEYWRGKFEEGAREMSALEVSELRRLNLSDIEAQVELLGRRLDTERIRTRDSFLYEKLLQEYWKAIRIQNMQDVLYARKTVWKLSLLGRKRSGLSINW